MNIQQAKALFFAKYLWQKVLIWEGYNSTYPCELNGTRAASSTSETQSAYLTLRTVNQLTDEEIITIAKIYNNIIDDKDLFIEEKTAIYVSIRLNYSWGATFKIYYNDAKFYGLNNVNKNDLACYNYMRSIGILLPITYLNEENKPVTLPSDEIVSLGWAKVELQEGNK